MDRQEEAERIRDIVEYAMAFYDYETVRKVQKDRDMKSTLEDEEGTDQFLKQVEGILGGKIDRDMMQQGKEETERRARAEQTQEARSPSTRSRIEQDLIRVKK